MSASPSLSPSPSFSSSLRSPSSSFSSKSFSSLSTSRKSVSKYIVIKPSVGGGTKSKTEAVTPNPGKKLRNSAMIVQDVLRRSFTEADGGTGNFQNSDATFATLEMLARNFPRSNFATSKDIDRKVFYVDFMNLWFNGSPEIANFVKGSHILQLLKQEKGSVPMAVSEAEFVNDPIGRIVQLFPLAVNPPRNPRAAYRVNLWIEGKEISVMIGPKSYTEFIQRTVSVSGIVVFQDEFKNWKDLLAKKNTSHFHRINAIPKRPSILSKTKVEFPPISQSKRDSQNSKVESSQSKVESQSKVDAKSALAKRVSVTSTPNLLPTLVAKPKKRLSSLVAAHPFAPAGK